MNATTLRRLGAFFALCLFWAAPLVAQQTDAGLSYQGRLLDADGQPVTGTVDVTLRIGPLDGDGGIETAGYTTTRSVEVIDGVFSVTLGDEGEEGIARSTFLPPSVAFPGEMWFPGEKWFPGEEWYPAVEAVVDGTSVGTLALQASPFAFTAGSLYGVDNVAAVSDKNVGLFVNNDGEGDAGMFAVYGGAVDDTSAAALFALTEGADGLPGSAEINADLSLDGGFQLVPGAAEDYVLTSDALGNGTWQPAPSGGGGGFALPLDETASTAAGVGLIRLQNTGEGDALRVQTASGAGLRVEGSGTDGVSSEGAGQNGFRALAPTLNGLRVEDAALAGVLALQPGSFGLNVQDPGTGGVFVTGGGDAYSAENIGGSGLRVRNPGEHGLHVIRAGDDGTHVTSAGRYGAYLRGDDFGLYATGGLTPTDTDGDGRTGAGFFDGDVFVDGDFHLLDPGVQDGYVLTSDASGQGTWQPAPGGSLALPFIGGGDPGEFPAVFGIIAGGGENEAPAGLFVSVGGSESAALEAASEGDARGPAAFFRSSTPGGAGPAVHALAETSSLSGREGAAGLFEDATTQPGSAVSIFKAGGEGTALSVRHADADAGDIARFYGADAAAPVARIDRNGDVFANTFNPGGADLAEAFAVEGPKAAYEPGDVLVISTRTDRTMERSAEARSTLVAGVYATQPGLVLSEDGRGAAGEAVPLGVVGVLPTKVTAENGPIRRGDLLVTAATPGHAMRAGDAPAVGTVLGKALEGFDGPGTGRIRVLVSVR